MSALTNWLESPDLLQFGSARAAETGDAVTGVMPHLVVEPSSPEAMAGALAWASRERLATVIKGHGTKLSWGRRPVALDVVISTARLDALVAHRHGDLTATVQAGAALADVNRALAREGQCLPLDSAFDGATIGGLVATNDSGPQRHRHGTPRDLLIGITLALTDGRVVKSGGHVVKNVAGYDLGKLVSGSFGTLAAIVDATFKLSPLVPASQTLAVRYDGHQPLAEAVARLLASQLEPAAIDLQVHLGSGDDRAARLLVRFATSPEATAAQVAAARPLLQGEVELLAGERETALWADQVRRPWSRPGGVVRLSWLPANLPQVLALLYDVRGASGGAVELTARAAVGAGFLHVGADGRGLHAAVDLLRSRTSSVSNVVVLGQPSEGSSTVDVWGPAPSAASVLRSVKNAFDPAGVLNAGRGPV